MAAKRQKTIIADSADKRAAMASPIRLEILGLFTEGRALAIADMAERMGRTAGSLYHHVAILEKAGLLRRTGTRPKGKRHEALFAPAGDLFEVAAPADEEEAVAHAVKAMAAAFRMTERDLEAALRDPTSRKRGRARNLFAGRMHLRASPKLLAEINEHLRAIEELVRTEGCCGEADSRDAQHVSLTIALLPIKGRGRRTPRKGG